MNKLRNKVQLIGNLGTDPEVKHLESGKTVATFRLATTERYRKDSGDLVEDTQWHNIVAWGKRAEIVEQYLQKGKEVAVEGKLIHRSYDDKNGDKKYITEIVMDDMVMLGKKPQEAATKA